MIFNPKSHLGPPRPLTVQAAVLRAGVLLVYGVRKGRGKGEKAAEGRRPPGGHRAT